MPIFTFLLSAEVQLIPFFFFGQQKINNSLLKLFLQMKDLGSKALQKIQNLIVNKDPRPRTTPQKQKSLTNFRPSKILQTTTIINPSPNPNPTLSPSPSPKPQPQRSPSGKLVPSAYAPREREIRLLEKKTKAIYAELEERVNYKVQNNRSFFLNQKNPKPPIYQRAEQIMRQREAALQEKRQAKIRQKEEQQVREYQEFLRMQINKKFITKEHAVSVTDRLYKDHYLKANRLYQQKIDRYKEQSQQYREKPLISSTSRELYQAVAQKNKLQSDIIDRFGQYEVQKAEKQKQSLKTHKDKYYPFKPLISDNSRVLISSREDKSQDLSRSSHCLSCHFLKSDYQRASPSNPRGSPSRRSHHEDYS